MKGGLPQALLSGANATQQTPAKGTKARSRAGVARATPVATRLTLLKPFSRSFGDVMHAKLQAALPKTDASILEKPQKAAEILVKRLAQAEPEKAQALQKAISDILEDSHLTARQKASKLKSLLEQASTQAQAPISHAALPLNATPPSRELAAAKPTPAPTATPAVARTVEPKVTVVDLRKAAKQRATEPAAVKAQQVRATAVERDVGNSVNVARSAEQRSAPASMPLPQPREPTTSAPGAPTPLQRLQQMAGSELTRAAGIVLKDGGGEIRLVLKPESLGSVRLRLNLTDNRIDGKIVVDNQAVKQILERSIPSLTQALSAEGFQTASLQVSVGGGGAGTERQDRETSPVYRAQPKTASFAVPDADGPMDWSQALVNLFA